MKSQLKDSKVVRIFIFRLLVAYVLLSVLCNFAINTSARNINPKKLANQTDSHVEEVVSEEFDNQIEETTDDNHSTSTTVETVATTEAFTTQVTETTTEVVSTIDESMKPILSFSSTSTTDTVRQINDVNESVNLLSQITVDSTTEERIIAAMTYFVDQGFTPEAAAGILGSVAVESGYNPSIVSSTGYYGLCQWNTSSAGGYWWNSIQDWILSNGFEWNSFEGQIKAIIECPSRGQLSDSRLEELKGLTSVDQAAELIAVYYEACVGGSTPTQYYRVGYCYQDLSLRSSEAWIAYNIYNDPSLEYTGKKPYIPN